MTILLNGSSALSVYFTILISCNYLALCRHQLTRSHSVWNSPTVLSEYEPLDFVVPSICLPNRKLLYCRLSIRDLTGPSGACLHQYAHKLKIIVDNCRGSHYYSVFGPRAQHHESLCAGERRGLVSLGHLEKTNRDLSMQAATARRQQESVTPELMA